MECKCGNFEARVVKKHGRWVGEELVKSKLMIVCRNCGRTTPVLCFSCREEKGFIPKDDGAHTAMVRECSGCGERKPILNDRHWVKQGK